MTWQIDFTTEARRTQRISRFDPCGVLRIAYGALLIAALVISEEVAATKHAAGIFDAAFAAMGHPDKREVLMIGASLSFDIRDTYAYGIATYHLELPIVPRGFA